MEIKIGNPVRHDQEHDETGTDKRQKERMQDQARPAPGPPFWILEAFVILCSPKIHASDLGILLNYLIFKSKNYLPTLAYSYQVQFCS